MCTYAFVHYKLHYACTSCRVSYKRHPPEGRGDGSDGRDGRDGRDAHVCPRCGARLLCAGHDFAAPRRSDRKAWTVVTAVLNAGLRYEGFEPCGCGRRPAFRPRTRAQLRARRVVAARTGTPLAELLGRADPLTPVTADGGPARR